MFQVPLDFVSEAVLVTGAAGWLALLLACAYAKAREPRRMHERARQ